LVITKRVISGSARVSDFPSFAYSIKRLEDFTNIRSNYVEYQEY